MAVSAQSGLWNVGSSWVGGVPPADGEDWSIEPGHTITFEGDTSAWTLGAGNITIKGAANGSTPGKFTVSQSPGTHILKLGNGKTIKGSTNAYNQGQFHIGTSKAVPYPYDCEFVLESVSGSTEMIDHTWLDMQVFCDMPPFDFRFAILTADVPIGSDIVYVDRDLRGQKFWRVGDQVVYGSRYGASFYQGVSTIAEVAANYIRLADAAIQKHYVGGGICSTRRNVRFLMNTTGHATTFTGGAYNNLSTGKAAFAENNLRSITGGSAHPRVSQGRMTVGGTVANSYYGGYFAQAVVEDMVWANIDAFVSGIEMQMKDCVGIAMNSTYPQFPAGTVMRNCRWISCSQVVGTTAIAYDTLFQHALQVQAAPAFGRFYDCSFIDNMRDFERMPEVLEYRCYHSTASIMNYPWYPANPESRLQHYDVKDSSGNTLWGRIRGYNAGGWVTSHTAVPPDPPIAMDFVHRAYFWEVVNNAGAYPTRTGLPNTFDFPISREPGQDISIKVHVKCNELPSLMVEPLVFQIVDLNAGFDDENEVLAAVSPADNTDWQTLTLSYSVGAHQRPALRMRGRAFRDSEHPWYADWFHVLEPLSSGGGTYPSADFVHADARTYGPTGAEYTPALSALVNWCLVAGITWPPLDEVDGGRTFGPITGTEYTGTGVNATTIRTALGLAAANLDTQLGAIPTVAEFEARTVPAANIATSTQTAAILDAVTVVDTVVDAIKAKTDTIPASPAAVGSAMTLTEAYDAAKTPAPTTAQIKTAIEADGSKLDHLWEMTEDDAGVRRLTQNALEQAPSSSGATAEEVWAHADRQLTSDGNIAVADATLTRDLKSITTTVTYCIYTFVMAALKSAVSGTSWLIQKPSGVEHKSGTVTTDVNGNITGADLGDES